MNPTNTEKVTVSDLLIFLSDEDLDEIQRDLERIYSSPYTRSNDVTITEQRTENVKSVFRSRVFISFSGVLRRDTQSEVKKRLEAKEERLKGIAEEIAEKYAGEFAKLYDREYSSQGRLSVQAQRRIALQELVEEIIDGETYTI